MSLKSPRGQWVHWHGLTLIPGWISNYTLCTTKLVRGGVYWFHSVWSSITHAVSTLWRHPVACCLFHGLHSYKAQIQPMSMVRGQLVAYHFQVNRSNVKVTQVAHIFAVEAGDILVDHWPTVSIYMHFFVWDEITWPFPNFSVATGNSPLRVWQVVFITWLQDFGHVIW